MTFQSLFDGLMLQPLRQNERRRRRRRRRRRVCQGSRGGGMGQAAHVSTIIIFNGHHIERFSEVFSFSNQIL